MGRKVYHCLVFFGRSRLFLQQIRPLVVQRHKCLCLFLSQHPPPLPTPASPQHLCCLFLKDARPYLRPPLVHLSGFMRVALLGHRHKSCPGLQAPAPVGGNPQQQATTSHSSKASAATAGPPSNPATSCLADYFAAAPCFGAHNGSERDRRLGHRLFFLGAIGCCKTQFLPQEEVGGFG